MNLLLEPHDLIGLQAQPADWSRLCSMVTLPLSQVVPPPRNGVESYNSSSASHEQHLPPGEHVQPHPCGRPEVVQGYKNIGPTSVEENNGNKWDAIPWSLHMPNSQ